MSAPHFKTHPVSQLMLNGSGNLNKRIQNTLQWQGQMREDELQLSFTPKTRRRAADRLPFRKREDEKTSSSASTSQTQAREDERRCKLESGLKLDFERSSPNGKRAARLDREAWTCTEAASHVRKRGSLDIGVQFECKGRQIERAQAEL